MDYTYEQIINDINNKIYKPLYLLYGEESYFIDKITDHIAANVLTSDEQQFNQLVMYGKDSDVKNIILAARGFPMMSNYKVVIVKEAQNLKQFDDLKVYFENPLKSTILVIAMKDTPKVDKRYKAVKLAEKIGVVYSSKKLRDYEIIKWVSNLATKYGLTFTPEAQRMMYEHIGTDLSRLDGEMNKLATAIEDKSKPVDDKTVAKNIGINRDFNIFELQKAVGTKDTFRAYQIADYFAQNSKSIYIGLVVKQLFDYFSRILRVHYSNDKSKTGIAALLGINPYFSDEYITAMRNYPVAKVISIVSKLREADARVKGVDGTYDDADIYKELLFKIMHV